jgi:AAA+ superfamily predicted ATPase
MTSFPNERQLNELDRGKDFIAEVTPRRRLEDLILPGVARQGVEELIEEQRRADVLRVHGLEPRSRILFVGPPGTGKTTLAEAGTVSFFVVRYEPMIGSYFRIPLIRKRSDLIKLRNNIHTIRI